MSPRGLFSPGISKVQKFKEGVLKAFKSEMDKRVDVIGKKRSKESSEGKRVFKYGIVNISRAGLIFSSKD